MADHGVRILGDPLCNKETAFTRGERLRLGIEGLLPPRVAHDQGHATRPRPSELRLETARAMYQPVYGT